MSQLAAIMSAGFGSFIIKTRAEKGKGTQRNAFVQTNFPLATTTSEGQDVKASIPMEQLKLTSSFINLPPLQLVAGTDGIQVSMTEIPRNVSTLRIVVVGYKDNVPAIQRISDVPVDSVHGSIRYSVDNLSKGDYTVLAYGLIPSESTKTKIDINNIHTSADESFISSVELNAMVADGSMVETKTVGQNTSLT